MFSETITSNSLKVPNLVNMVGVVVHTIQDLKAFGEVLNLYIKLKQIQDCHEYNERKKHNLRNDYARTKICSELPNFWKNLNI